MYHSYHRGVYIQYGFEWQYRTVCLGGKQKEKGEGGGRKIEERRASKQTFRCCDQFLEMNLFLQCRQVAF